MISIIIPCKNEADNLAALIPEIETAMQGREIEIIIVDDGSTDHTADFISAEREKRDCDIRHLRHDKSGGKSAAMRTGFFAAHGEISAVLDGDGQNNPADIPRLIDALLADKGNAGLVSGHRTNRKHTAIKNLSSKFANKLRRGLLKDGTSDAGCGHKVARTDLFRRLPYFKNYHRFLGALVCQEGYTVLNVEVVDRERTHGTSNYGILDRGLAGALDLLGVWWLNHRRLGQPHGHEVER
ncbi:MAG: glycosyltransferase family 2 protein [Pseudomonadota bacterium]